MNRADAEEYTEALSLVVAGGWRQVALGERLGVPKALGVSTRQWVEERLGGYVRLSLEERRDAVKELTEEGLSQRRTSGVLGINRETVAKDLDGTQPRPQESEPAALAGNQPPPRESEPATLAGNQPPPRESEPAVPAGTRPRQVPPRARPEHVQHNSGDEEWFTPAAYVDAARAVMGGIDLDPASSEEANGVIRARRYYTPADDGLSKPWKGRIWMNPPYSSGLVDRFCTRLAREYTGGAIKQACALVNNATETGWFQEMLAQASGVCFPRGRVRFWHPTKPDAKAPLQGQAIVYLGPSPDDFAAEFRRFGFVGVRA